MVLLSITRQSQPKLCSLMLISLLNPTREQKDPLWCSSTAVLLHLVTKPKKISLLLWRSLQWGASLLFRSTIDWQESSTTIGYTNRWFTKLLKIPELLWDMSEVLLRIRELILIESCLWVKVLELSLLFTMGMLHRLNMKVTVVILVSLLRLLRMEQFLDKWKLKGFVQVFTHGLMVAKSKKMLTKLKTLPGKTRYLFCWFLEQKILSFLTLIAKKFSLELKRLVFHQLLFLSKEHSTFHGNKSSLQNTIHPSCKTSLTALILQMLKHQKDVMANPIHSCNSKDQWTTFHSHKKSLLYQLTNKFHKKIKTKQMVKLNLLEF